MQKSERTREVRVAKRLTAKAKNAGAARVTIREERIEFRVRPETKDLLIRASELIGGNLTAFVLESAQQRAVEVIERYERLRLTDNDRDRLLAALEKPPAPAATLRKAFHKHG